MKYLLLQFHAVSL